MCTKRTLQAPVHARTARVQGPIHRHTARTTRLACFDQIWPRHRTSTSAAPPSRAWRACVHVRAQHRVCTHAVTLGTGVGASVPARGSGGHVCVRQEVRCPVLCLPALLVALYSLGTPRSHWRPQIGSNFRVWDRRAQNSKGSLFYPRREPRAGTPGPEARSSAPCHPCPCVSWLARGVLVPEKTPQGMSRRFRNRLLPPKLARWVVGRGSWENRLPDLRRGTVSSSVAGLGTRHGATCG